MNPKDEIVKAVAFMQSRWDGDPVPSELYQVFLEFDNYLESIPCKPSMPNPNLKIRNSMFRYGLRREYSVPVIEGMFMRLEYYNLMGCYGFSDSGTFYGIESDGYLHS